MTELLANYVSGQWIAGQGEGTTLTDPVLGSDIVRVGADGLDLPDNDSVIAYRDTVQGLEYLRRSRDFVQHGLTVGLRGYQHMALLEFRVMQPTATHPWDRLSDALGGSGVYSVDDALNQMRMRPLHEALRWAVSKASRVAGRLFSDTTPPITLPSSSMLM